jgi:hypothetical protein
LFKKHINFQARETVTKSELIVTYVVIKSKGIQEQQRSGHFCIHKYHSGLCLALMFTQMGKRDYNLLFHVLSIQVLTLYNIFCRIDKKSSNLEKNMFW